MTSFGLIGVGNVGRGIARYLLHREKLGVECCFIRFKREQPICRKILVVYRMQLEMISTLYNSKTGFHSLTKLGMLSIPPAVKQDSKMPLLQHFLSSFNNSK